jgi:hypothetical protein
MTTRQDLMTGALAAACAGWSGGLHAQTQREGQGVTPAP